MPRPSLPLAAAGLLLLLCGGATAQSVLSNGVLRFGSGSEHSFDSAGNLKQPWIFSGATQQWFKLTFGSNALNMALGLDYGNAASWAGAFVSEFSMLTPLSSSDDPSQLVATGQVGSLVTGYGNFTTRRRFVYRGAEFEVVNKYQLPAGDNFIQVDTTVTNVGATDMWNARLWAGSR